MRWLGWELMQVLWHIWFGNFDVVILDCDHPGKTQRSQIKVVSFVDFSYKKHRPLTNLTKGAVIQKHIRFKISFEKQQQVAKLVHYFNDIANGIIFGELHFFVSFLSCFVLYSFSASNSLQGGTYAPWSALSLLMHNRDDKLSLLSERGYGPIY